jgi:hypothetical protein
MHGLLRGCGQSTRTARLDKAVSARVVEPHDYHEPHIPRSVMCRAECYSGAQGSQSYCSMSYWPSGDGIAAAQIPCGTESLVLADHIGIQAEGNAARKEKARRQMHTTTPLDDVGSLPAQCIAKPSMTPGARVSFYVSRLGTPHDMYRLTNMLFSFLNNSYDFHMALKGYFSVRLRHTFFGSDPIKRLHFEEPL